MTIQDDDRKAVADFEKVLAFEVKSFIEDRLGVERPGCVAANDMVLIAMAHLSGFIIANTERPTLKLSWFLNNVRSAVDLESKP